MNEYRKFALEIRKKVSKLTLEQQKQVLSLYEDVIKDLAKTVTIAKDKSLTKRWFLSYQKEIEKAKKELSKELNNKIKKGIETAAKLGTESEQLVMRQIFQLANIDPGEHFINMFSQIQKGVIGDIISGRIYYDNKTLSRRIWDATNKFKGDIQYIVNQGILEKKSALELARDLERFVEDPARRPWDWGKVYPNLRGTKIDYNAQRLARTAINHSYQTASIKSSNMNPFVEGIEWRSALIHGRTCEICRERHGQVFPKDDVPLDHPNGLCTMIPYMHKNLDEVAIDLRNWLDGERNPILDDWYQKYGDYFAFKKVESSYNFTGNSKANSGIINTKKIDAKLQEFLTKIDNIKDIDVTKRREIASQLLEKLELQNIPIRIKQIKQHGYCSLDNEALYNKNKIVIKEYVLNSEDIRSDSYKIKTVFHEAFHAKANGFKTDYLQNTKNWLQIEEVFAETSAHFLYKQLGFKEEISPSYAEKLVEMLPRLKRLDKFKNCKTFADFGEVAWTDRLNNVPAEWLQLYNDAMKIEYDWTKYVSEYIEYIENNKDDLLDIMLNNMPQYKQYKSYMSLDFENAKEKIQKGKQLTSNENMVIKNLIAVTMGRLGVK